MRLTRRVNEVVHEYGHFVDADRSCLKVASLICAQPALLAAYMPGTVLASDERVRRHLARGLVEHTDLRGVLVVGGEAENYELDKPFDVRALLPTTLPFGVHEVLKVRSVYHCVWECALEL